MTKTNVQLNPAADVIDNNSASTVIADAKQNSGKANGKANGKAHKEQEQKKENKRSDTINIFVADVKALSVDQICSGLIQTDVRYSELAAELLARNNNDVESALSTFKQGLRQVWPNFNVRGKGTKAGEENHKPQKLYNRLAWHYREDESATGKKKGTPRTLKVVVEMFFSQIHGDNHKGEDWISAFVSNPALTKEEKAALKKAL